MSSSTALGAGDPTRRNGKLRVGLLTDGVVANKYVYELAQWAVGHADLDVSHLAIVGVSARAGRRSSAGTVRGIYGALSALFFQLVIKLERFLIKRIRRHAHHFATFSLDQIVAQQLAITALVSPDEPAYRFSADDIGCVRELNLDLLVYCGSGSLPAEVLGAARLGVISFHFADRELSGGPVGFWEAFYRAEKTNFCLHRLTQEADGALVLRRGAFTTQFFWTLNQAHLYKKSNEHLKEVIQAIAAHGELPAVQAEVPYVGPACRPPQLHESLVYVFKVVYRVAIKVCKRAVGLRDRWSVSFIHGDWRNAALPGSKPIPNPPGRFLADPFLHTREGRTYCFMEDYSYRACKGHISVYEIRASEAVEIGACLTEPFHLSFPYLFAYRGDLYMCPETNDASQIRVYRSNEFPLKWELAAVLMDGIRAADTMLFEHDRKWWMLTNIDKSEIGDHCAELYLFHADSPLSDHWTPHPLNPLYIDPDIARNAGLFIDNGKLFRAAQRQAFDTYGKAFAIFEIKTLNETQYVEQRVASIEPDFKPGLKGTHHMSTTGSTTVVDHVSVSFVR